MKLDLDILLNVTDGILVNDQSVLDNLSLVIDSRQAKENTIYWPILGEVHDGHKFIGDAFKNGASVALCENAYYYSHLSSLRDYPLILVDNTTKALHRLTKYVLERLNLPVIGITGSVGKTSTKEMIYHVLKDTFNVHKNKGNFNNHIGMPLTVLDLEVDHEVVILEMGMNHFKEIETLVDIARPNIGVITNIGTSHIGILGSQENIFQAKMELVSYFDEENTLILNGLDPYLKEVDSEIFKVVKTFETNLNPIHIMKKEDGCYTFDLALDEVVHFELNVLGEHQIKNALLAIGVGLELGVPIKTIAKGLSEFKENTKRLEMLQGKKGMIINDCYNASQESMKAAIDVLNNQKGKTIAVLGDVLELGDFAQLSHESVGAYIAEHPVDFLVTYGKDSQYISKMAVEKGYASEHTVHYSDMSILIEALDELLTEDSYMLVKGSFGMKMIEIVEALKKEEK
ncbi:MAG: UDP-N-acetylmuramoyl-tripeptide--D-alanyl-D-alanine ligase [Clostridia bacterium]|nr:UDP-N-acetylmuramoyl-tripeptide--D-alanyl-D-alanine ligase [Clostridia bacterium]